MIEQWKNPDPNISKINKVLVIGITHNLQTKRIFELGLVNALEKKGVRAVKSVDFFEKSFTEVQKTEEQLNEIENQLINAGFDSVLFTTVTGLENKMTTIQSFKEVNSTFGNFRDYYYDNQHLFYEDSNPQVYQVYHTETALYCVCPGKERELLWQGFIDIVDPYKMEQSVSDYVKVLMREFKKQEIFVND